MENVQQQNNFDIENNEMDFMAQLRQIVDNRQNSDMAVRGKVSQLLNQYKELS